MNLYETTDEQAIEAYGIAVEMYKAGLPAAFVRRVVELASLSEGIYDLVTMWRDVADGDSRTEIVADLQDAIDDHAEAPLSEKPKVSFAQFDSVTVRIAEFKKQLRARVMAWGGISQLATATGMPQPSLSRFFGSTSMPRRSTLFKIAKAMDLDESQIVFDWTI